MSARNLVDEGGARAAVRSVQAQYKWMRPELVWDDFAWMREQWDGPVYIKGVLDAEDAARAIDLGGRPGSSCRTTAVSQLDGAVATSGRAAPAIARRLDGQGEILIDGGIVVGATSSRRCASVRRRYASVARIFTVSVHGAPPVSRHVLNILSEEVARTMTLTSGMAGGSQRVLVDPGATGRTR